MRSSKKNEVPEAASSPFFTVLPVISHAEDPEIRRFVIFAGRPVWPVPGPPPGPGGGPAAGPGSPWHSPRSTELFVRLHISSIVALARPSDRTLSLRQPPSDSFVVTY